MAQISWGKLQESISHQRICKVSKIVDLNYISDNYFDTIVNDSTKISDLALKKATIFEIFQFSRHLFDETVQLEDVKAILNIFKSSEVEPF